MDGPVRVKIYGLFSVTRRQYLVQLGFVVFVGLTMLAVWAWMNSNLLHELEQSTQSPILVWAGRIPWIIGGLLTIVGVEAFFVLRALARKEALAKETTSPPAEAPGQASQEEKAASQPAEAPPTMESPAAQTASATTEPQDGR